MDLVVHAWEVGIACRYKAGPHVRSTDEGGHADAILPRGVPVGYYARTRRDRRLAIVAPGMVRDAAALLRDRPEYMRAGEARGRNCLTTFAVLDVGEARAAAFAAAWEAIAADPPLFVAVGGNCAQVITRALEGIGALPRGWLRPGSPDALFRAVVAAHPGARIATGFAEFTPDGSGGYGIRLENAVGARLPVAA
ncbi:MAG: hypothetical protein K2X11_04995 [Acetobacteraceae bacterium]|nr:hypothetical protein [Acetobacteraceae bacterium]